MHLSRRLYKILQFLKPKIWENRRVLITSTSVAGCVLILRLTGLLQTWELAALDQFFRWRPGEKIDKRILIVEIGEKEIQQYGIPISDKDMANLLQKLQKLQPRAIGLDIYRSRSVEDGHKELLQAFKNIPNLIAIEKIGDSKNPGINAPEILKEKNQVGFNNLVFDIDGKVRRSLLYWHVEGKQHTSFALKLALIYLKQEGIKPESAQDDLKSLQLGQSVFRRFDANDGAYINTDAGGYQILVNFRGAVGIFPRVSMTDVLADKIDPELVRDRIVVIGSTAPSLKDFFFYPYSSIEQISGVELHANFISQIISAALYNRPLIQVLSASCETILIFLWAWIGASLSWKYKVSLRAGFSLFLAGFTLIGIVYIAFLFGWWLPVIPPVLACFGSAIAITSYIAQLEEELKKSKEFLQTIINTIPDPVFVKDKDHRWIVLNEAFCQLIGYPLEKLIKKTDYNFFPKAEADIFWQQDQLVFYSKQQQENEEKLTDAKGEIHYIETKRSLHRDAGGNIFLVGVIRDITERKRMEEELKRTASELASSNADLKIAKDYLHKLAYYDALTGLPNRKLFYERLQQSIEWAAAHKQLIALMFLDLDGFKLINDTQGHYIGDLLLKGVADRLTACLRGSDTISRLGGDEFTVILPGIPTQQDIARVAEKIITTLTKDFILEGHNISVTSSIGISVYPIDGDTPDTLVKKADMAMYFAKDKGKNRYEFLSETGNQTSMTDKE